MKTTRYDERDLTEQLFHYGPPALAWALVLAFFAFSGTVLPDPPKEMATAAPAHARAASETSAAPAMVSLTAMETDDLPATAQSKSGSREPAMHDAAVVTHELLDPVGAGANPAH